ncbi:transcription factor AIG1-like [Lolium rigidum]|uniref:transcription factor AIG1-like n=1 Tax=Lolium rigidum TaxID=89674 RepID=UPI001F5D6949|nr:transcription factor AIG1-like [Lolium rigidum]
MWEGAGVHGSHEALLLQAAGGVTHHGGDHSHASGLLPWLGPAAAASPYMIPHLPPAPYGAEISEAAGTFGIGAYPEGGGLGHQYGLFDLEPPQQHGNGGGGGGGAPSLQMGPRGSRMVSGLLGSLHAELGRLSAKEIMDAKALAASRSHSEAERRRRQRINSHLSRLRSLLPNTTKTDKASLLAEVIEHVKELKRQTSGVPVPQLLPTEADELAVDAAADEEGTLVVRASLCCEDRQDLVPDIVRALAALRLRARRAEIATLGGRVRNVLLISEVGEDDGGEDGRHGWRDDDDECAATSHRRHELVASIQEALRGVVDRKAASSDTSSSGGGSMKRQRMNEEQEQGSF